MSAGYFLSPHIHVCVSGNHVVLLDLERDKYVAVVPPDRLARWVRGWPVSCGAESTDRPGVKDGLVASMIEQGMLVADPALGKEAVPVATVRPEATLLQFEFDKRPSTTLSHFRDLFLAYTAARSALKWRPIKSVVRAVAARNSRALEQRGKDKDMATGCRLRPMEMEAARGLVAAFVHLRPLFFTSRDACLLDSLTLLNFLARSGIFPSWVFGVRTAPFVAHCWVQADDTVFNDNPDYVRGYTPILVA
jgi:hypothetical protein